MQPNTTSNESKVGNARLVKRPAPNAQQNVTQIKKNIKPKNSDPDGNRIDSDDVNKEGELAEEVSSGEEIENIDNGCDEQPPKKIISKTRKKDRVTKTVKKYLPKKVSDVSVDQETKNGPNFKIIVGCSFPGYLAFQSGAERKS